MQQQDYAHATVGISSSTAASSFPALLKNEDILGCIFEFIGVNPLNRFMRLLRVCKHWHSFITYRAKFLFKRIDLALLMKTIALKFNVNDNGKYNSEVKQWMPNIAHILATYCSPDFLRELVIVDPYYSYVATADERAEFVTIFKKFFPTLTHLTVPLRTNHSLMGASTIDYESSGFPVKTSQNSLYTILSELEQQGGTTTLNLKYLNISTGHATALTTILIFKWCKQLEHLHFYETMNATLFRATTQPLTHNHAQDDDVIHDEEEVEIDDEDVDEDNDEENKDQDQQAQALKEKQQVEADQIIKQCTLPKLHTLYIADGLQVFGGLNNGNSNSDTEKLNKSILFQCMPNLQSLLWQYGYDTSIMASDVKALSTFCPKLEFLKYGGRYVENEHIPSVLANSIEMTSRLKGLNVYSMYFPVKCHVSMLTNVIYYLNRRWKHIKCYGNVNECTYQAPSIQYSYST